jgi:hypothetical protein
LPVPVLNRQYRRLQVRQLPLLRQLHPEIHVETLHFSES